MEDTRSYWCYFARPFRLGILCSVAIGRILLGSVNVDVFSWCCGWCGDYCCGFLFIILLVIGKINEF